MFIDLNSDLGESFGVYTLGLDKEVLAYATSANVACGWHAGDPLVMEKTVRLAKELGVAVGAHPGYPDLMGFGRRNMAISPDEARLYVLYQVGALQTIAKAHGVSLQHVKLHGAFYNQAMKDPVLADAVIDGLLAMDTPIPVLALSGSYFAKTAKDKGLVVYQEVFADRGYQEDGSLVPRGQAGAMITDPDEALTRVLQMIREQTVVTNTGVTIPMVADSVCVHGDNPKAIAFVKSLREGLEAAGVIVRNFQHR